MRQILLLTFIIYIFNFTLSHAQSFSIHLPSTLSETLIPSLENDANHPCISESEYKMLEETCSKNIKLLGLLSQRQTNSTALVWPLKASASLKDCSYYYIAAYVDQDTLTGTIKDFNCGSSTYDGYRGTDISIWPFNFYKMDNNLVDVVAAAPGTILAVHDGEFDRNCTSNSMTANYIMIQHADGSQALYWHMKNGSVTTKTVGQTIAVGERLGIVGSSGSSSGPHLHFEIWAGSTVTTRIDPYTGSCNLLNNSAWWASQKPYKETEIIKATVPPQMQ